MFLFPNCYFIFLFHFCPIVHNLSKSPYIITRVPNLDIISFYVFLVHSISIAHHLSISPYVVTRLPILDNICYVILLLDTTLSRSICPYLSSNSKTARVRTFSTRPILHSIMTSSFRVPLLLECTTSLYI